MDAGKTDGVLRLVVQKVRTRHHLPQQCSGRAGHSLRLYFYTIGRYPQAIIQLWWEMGGDGINSEGTGIVGDK